SSCHCPHALAHSRKSTNRSSPPMSIYSMRSGVTATIRAPDKPTRTTSPCGRSIHVPPNDALLALAPGQTTRVKRTNGQRCSGRTIEFSSGGRAERQRTPRNQDRGRRLLQRRVRRGSAHRSLHERDDPCLSGGGQLLQREGGRPHGAFVEARLVAEAERRVPRLELLRA